MTKWASNGGDIQNIPKRFRLLVRRYYHDAGEIVYPCKRRNLQLEKQHTEENGTPYVTVTTDPNGDFPAFTVARENLEVLEHE